MTLLSRRLTTRTLTSIITAVAVLAVGVPLVGAYEAHTVNVTAHVKDNPRVPLVKTMELANETEIDEFLAEVGGMDPPIPNFPPDRPDNLACDNATSVPINTFILWLVTISVSNNGTVCWTDIVVRDNFSAELGGVAMAPDVVDLFVKSHSRGNSKKEIFETQYRITWYVTCDLPNPDPDPDPGDPVCLDNGGCLEPGQSESLEIYVWTKLNPAGNQEYTSPGTYTMNSGPNVRWYIEGQQFSFDGDPLDVNAE